jgi:hypothetical protein
MTTNNHDFIDSTLDRVNSLTNDTLQSLDYEYTHKADDLRPARVLEDSIASAQRMLEFCHDSARGASLDSDTNEWTARAWEYRLELEALKYTELMTSLVASTNEAHAKADASWNASLAVNQ